MTDADIDVRKLAEKALRESEEKHRALIENLSDLILILDKDGVNLWNSPSVRRFGMEPEDAIGINAREFAHPDDLSRLNETLEYVVQHPGETVKLKGLKAVTSAGTLYLDDTLVYLPDTPGINGIVVVVHDVTDIRKAQNDLIESENYNRMLFEQSPIGLALCRMNGELVDINPAYAQIIGRSIEETKQLNYWDISPQKYAEVELEQLVSLNKTGRYGPYEKEYIHKDGHLVQVSLQGLLLEKDGEQMIWSSVEDITERASMETTLRRSQKMDALGKLTGGVAHDFNNTLGVILGYSDMLEEELHEHPKLKEYAKEIYHAGLRGSKLTNKLLAFSRNKPSDAEVININTLLHEEQHMLEKTLTVRIKLVFDLALDLWPVWLDSGDLEDAIINISINSMHAIKEHGQLTIQSRNTYIDEKDAKLLQIDAGDYVMLSIIDTGSGMDQVTKERIFEPFFSTKEEKGTGLGLSQVYGFMQRSGGTIKVYTELGHGTQMMLYFPRYQEKSSDNKITKSNDATILGGNETILLVDDETALLMLTTKILSQQGYRILSAENGKQALEILEKEFVDLMLSDVIMPEMDGYQLSSLVQQKYPNIKIQLASGFSDKVNVDMVDDILVQNMLHKPISTQTLLKSIRQLLDK